MEESKVMQSLDQNVC